MEIKLFVQPSLTMHLHKKLEEVAMTGSVTLFTGLNYWTDLSTH